jgi:hypothetical protein
MPTHTDNRHYGNFITGDVNIAGDFNNVDGVSQEALLAFIPASHDLSNQADGAQKEFVLDPPIKQGTYNWVALYIDGVRLKRGADENDLDYYIPNTRNKVILADAYGPAPAAGSLIEIIYVEDTNL